MRRPAPHPLAQYADTVTVVVRHTPQQMQADPDYEVATVARFAAGTEVPIEAVRVETLDWLAEGAGFAHHSIFESRRRHTAFGAAGVEAVIALSLLGGVASGLT